MRHSFLHGCNLLIYFLGPWLVCLVMMMFTCSLQRVECHRERDGRWTAECWASHGCVSVSFQICILFVCSDIKNWRQPTAYLMNIWLHGFSQPFWMETTWFHTLFCLHLIQYNIEVVDLVNILILWHMLIMPLRYWLTWSKSKMEQSWCIETFASVHIV